MTHEPNDSIPLLPVEQRGDVTIVAFPCARYDNITDAINRASFLVEAHDELGEHIANHQPPHIVVDFDRIMSVNSGVLGLLAAAHQRATAGGGAVYIAGAQPRVSEALAVTALDKLLKVYDSVDEAVAAFG